LVSSNNGWRPLLDRGLFPAIINNNETALNPPPVTEPVDPPVAEQGQPAESPASPITVTEPIVPETAPSNLDLEYLIFGEPSNATTSVTENIEPERPSTLPSQPEIPVPETSTSMPLSNEEIPNNPSTTAESPERPIIINPPTEISERPSDEPVTPVVVPERIPTPPQIPEPTLDELPSEVITSNNNEASTTTDAPPPAVTSNDDNSSDSDGSQSQNNDEERSSSPAPAATSPSNRLRLNKICRNCSASVFFWGARNWWITERAKAVLTNELPEEVRKRKDCETLGTCDQELDNCE
jgi:hypothetical protein